MSLPVALQLYSVRDEFAGDLRGTLNQVKEMGYDGVELAGFGPHGAPAVAAALAASGLKCVGAHVSFDVIMESPQRVFAEYKALGCDYVSIPWMSMETAPGGELFNRTIPVIEQFGKAAREYGVTLLYHNHEFEFRKIGDKYGLDVLYESIAPEFLQTQIDTCWVKMIGIDPAAYIRKYAGRAPLVHIKDFEQTGEIDGAPYDLIGAVAKGERPKRGSFTFKAVGDGVQDVPAILQASLDAGAQWVVVEYDMSPERPPMETARKSREYLKSLGW